MNLIQWCRLKLIGPPDPVVSKVSREIQNETSRLNGASKSLSREIEKIESRRGERKSVSDILDETMRAFGKKQ